MFAVLLFTGLRIGDAARLARQHVQRDGTIKIRTEKTGREVEIEIVPPLKRALADGPHGRPEVLNFLTSAREGVGQELPRLVVRRTLPGDRPRPLGARAAQDSRPPVRRKPQDRY